MIGDRKVLGDISLNNKITYPISGCDIDYNNFIFNKTPKYDITFIGSLDDNSKSELFKAYRAGQVEQRFKRFENSRATHVERQI